jgi:phosphoserine phosphatase
MTTIYLVRHGRTDWNKEQMFRGRADRPLDEVGHAQGARVAQALSSKNIQAIYTSPLIRAIDTGKPLAEKLGLSMHVMEGLNDMDFGRWEGLPVDEAQKEYPDEFAQWMKTPFKAQIPGGESLALIADRAEATLEEISRQSEIERVVVVSHRVVLKVLLCRMVQAGEAGFWAFKIDPGSICEVQYDLPNSVISAMNYTDHMIGIEGLSAMPDF